MSCSVQSDLDMFPGCADVVRVGTDRWTQHNTDALDCIMEGVGDFLREHSHLDFEKLVKAYEQNEPRVKVGKQRASILYGPPGPFFQDWDELKTDIRGLVFKPISRVHKRKLIIEI